MRIDSSPGSEPDGWPRWQLVAALAIALVVRSGTLYCLSGHLGEDPDSYVRLAENLVATGVYGYREPAAGPVEPTAYRAPLYPLLVALTLVSSPTALWPRACLHLALALATVALVLSTGRRMGLHQGAFAAGVLVACDPILVYHSTLPMTETTAAFLAVVVLAALVGAGPELRTDRVALAGGSVGLAVLVRPVFLATGVVIGLALILLAKTWRRRLRTASVFALCCAVVLFPWVTRNVQRFGRPIVTTTHGGYTFRLGNHPAFYHYLRTAPWGATWKAPDEIGQDGRLAAQKLGPASRAEREMAIDRYHYRQAVQTIADQPTMFAWASLVRMGRLWQLVPHRAGPGETQAARCVRYTIGVWYLLETGLAVVGLLVLGRRLRYPPWLWTIVFCVSFTLVHTVYWSNMRMRAPLIPVIALLAAAGLTQCQCESVRTRWK